MHIGLWMRSAAARRLWVWHFLAAWLLAACTHTTSCGKGDKHLFETPAKEPRGATIVLRSYRGSQETLMNTAAQMMMANPRFGEVEGGSEAVYLAAKGAEPAHAVGAITFGSQASVAELLRMMAAVTERLTPVPDRDPAHPALKLELWWVQDVHGSADGVELPNPIILDPQWANELFATAASDYAVSAAKEGKESRLWVGRVARMFEGNRGKGLDARVQLHGDRERLEVSREQDQTLFVASARDDLGLFPQAARTAFVADIYMHQVEADPKLATYSPQRKGKKAETMLDERALSWVEPVQVDLPAGSDAPAQIRLWIAACRAAAAKASLAVRNVVVFDATPTQLRGALLGEQKPAAELTPYAMLERDVGLGLIEPGVPTTGKTLTLFTRSGVAEADAGQPTPPSP